MKKLLPLLALVLVLIVAWAWAKATERARYEQWETCKEYGGMVCGLGSMECECVSTPPLNEGAYQQEHE